MIEKLLNALRLSEEKENFDTIHDIVEKNIVFRGTNLWILIFAIVIASIGLNVNSTAVIIGAMLISPLMGPITGIGYSIATYDFVLLKKALFNFGFAVGASLLASTAYFAISPLSDAYSELLARTSPTIYDVLIALFGGLAGIVATTTKNKGNVIPGVAIATALMPPLCTAGYGLATAKWSFFFGAFYLFTINTVFIALATLLTTKFLKFPIKELINEKKKIRANRWIMAIVFITTVPSIYFGYTLVKKEQFTFSAQRYINDVTIVEGGFLLKNEINAEKREIKLIYGGRTIDSLLKSRIRGRAADFGLNDVNVIFQQGLNLSDLNKELTQTESFKTEITRLKSLLQESEARIDSLINPGGEGSKILREIKAIFPEITAIAVSKVSFFTAEGKSDAGAGYAAIIKSEAPGRTIQNKSKIEKWLKTRINTDKIFLIMQ